MAGFNSDAKQVEETPQQSNLKPEKPEKTALLATPSTSANTALLATASNSAASPIKNIGVITQKPFELGI